MTTEHIKQPKDLQTTHKATLEGFLEQAIAKSNKATPYIEEALKLWDSIKKYKTIDALITSGNFSSLLVSACGFSQKSKAKFSKEELDSALKTALRTISKNAETNFKEELIFRYLLTKGDSLGGSMRNYAGASASKKLIALIKSQLEILGYEHTINEGASGKTQFLRWRHRVLFFDVTSKLVGKNIDMVLVDNSNEDDNCKNLLKEPSNYLACGELKGGIDPAGADEHWKTANSALERIRNAFGELGLKPKLFFIGSAIESAMAIEIFNQLTSGKLQQAANLGDPNQTADLVTWLVQL